MGVTGWMGKTRMKVRLFAIKTSSESSCISATTFSLKKHKWKNVHTGIFIPVTGDFVCFSPKAAFIRFPFHWGEENVFTLYLSVADGKGTYKGFPGFFIPHLPCVVGKPSYRWSLLAWQEHSRVLFLLPWEPQSWMETICLSRNHRVVGKADLPSLLLGFLLTPTLQIRRSQWSFADSAPRFLLSGLLRVGLGRRAWMLKQRHHRFLEAFLFSADQCLRKLRYKVTILLLLTFVYAKRFFWLWLDIPFYPSYFRSILWISLLFLQVHFSAATSVKLVSQTYLSEHKWSSF